MKKIAPLLRLPHYQSLIGRLQAAVLKNFSPDIEKNNHFNLRNAAIATDLSLESIFPKTENKTKINTNVSDNFLKLGSFLFFLPLFFLASIVLFLYYQDALSIDSYIEIQKNSFFFLNSKLSQFPNLAYNLTQLGDTLILLSLLSPLIVYAPKIWEALISASLVTAVFSCFLKKIFSVPRPAAVFDNNSFFIIGKKVCGHNSLPSGHSMVIFTVLTVLLFAFIPKKANKRILWFFLLVIIGLILVFTRVAVGAHYPLDVIIGATIGYISGLLGIFISRKYKFFNWINNKKYYPVFMLLLLVCCMAVLNKIINENLIIFYLSLIPLLVSLYKTAAIYVKK